MGISKRNLKKFLNEEIQYYEFFIKEATKNKDFERAAILSERKIAIQFILNSVIKESLKTLFN